MRLVLWAILFSSLPLKAEDVLKKSIEKHEKEISSQRGKAPSLEEVCAEKMAGIYEEIAEVLNKLAQVKIPQGADEVVHQTNLDGMQGSFPAHVAIPLFNLTPTENANSRLGDSAIKTRKEKQALYSALPNKFKRETSPTAETYDPNRSTAQERLRYTVFRASLDETHDVKIGAKQVEQRSVSHILCGSGDYAPVEGSLSRFKKTPPIQYLLQTELFHLRAHIQKAYGYAVTSNIAAWENLLKDLSEKFDREIFTDPAIKKLSEQQVKKARQRTDLWHDEHRIPYSPDF